ncbi:MAG: decaprenyl-phosphate phosphoribosyltransferase [Planctomycetes bacterium]|nr:decaprenyl-phosphate phosphoribosyltransferase [Planctomycetota bacterium]
MLNYFRLMRPSQWIKNIVVLAGPAFSLHLFDIRVPIVFAAFCLIASASYVLNDLADCEADKVHPVKKNRPLASGVVSPNGAAVLSLVLLILAIVISHFWLRAMVTYILLSYFVLILAYSFLLKKHPIIDVIIIAVGFVLRAVAGAEAVAVLVSPWLIACTFTLCMFLGFGKRRCELAILTNKADAEAHRPTLLRYTPELLNHLISVSAGIAIMTFLLYTMDFNPRIPHPPFAKELLLYTLPLVAYALFRYAMLIETGRFSGPMQIVQKDMPLLVTGLIWVAVVTGIVLKTRVDQVASVVAGSGG